MTIPALKRITIKSEQELRNWLTKNSGDAQSVMLVTHTKTSVDKHVSHEDVHTAFTEHGWTNGRKYILNGNLIGHVITHG